MEQRLERNGVSWLGTRELQFQLLLDLQLLALEADDDRAIFAGQLLRKLVPVFLSQEPKTNELTLFCEQLYALPSPEGT